MNVSIKGPVTIRLVHRPGSASLPSGAFVGWGPKLGSI
jgi:hypothetical protein